MKRKAFTLVEILVSITLFSIIVLFLYQTLDITKQSNDFYTKHLDEKQLQNHIKKILFMDIMHSKENSVKISKDKDNNTILTMETTNTYHNPFFNHITYLLIDGELIRMETKVKFDRKKLNDSFFSNSYIDILQTKVDKFKAVIQKDKKVSVYILKGDKKYLFGF
ncbi:MAG: prepilin-type N-terminal cleavage/methylation domain-containing protein [Campylobacterota bacterium]|nr:prepilin-type N-terminal cleavage/methylation domain-containing protein [Campylobacterota bacterium]